MDREKRNPAIRPRDGSRRARSILVRALITGFFVSLILYEYRPQLAKLWRTSPHSCGRSKLDSPYGVLPDPKDPFLFLPCTNATSPPPLDDPKPSETWGKLFDPNPESWSWGNKTSTDATLDDPFAGRGIYLCGYLDVPLDYTNASDPRIVRLAVTKYQVSGLARSNGADSLRHAGPVPGSKSERTLVIEPGGPGGSGTSMAWRSSEQISERLSDGKYDVLGWDPRGVNTSLPAISCFPYDADRDRWSLLKGQYREVSGSPAAQLALADAMNDATFRACRELHGDLARFVGTAFVARDLEQIRVALGEDELTGYLVSYGTGIGQTYANMFPDSVGRLILDGTEYVRDHRLLGGFGWTALDNVTDAWHDGFLGECLHAGPEHCALAKPIDSKEVTLQGLEDRMHALVSSVLRQPVAAYTEASGPSLVTYSLLVQVIYGALYNAQSWPALAEMLLALEAGNSTLAATFIERQLWEYNPRLPIRWECKDAVCAPPVLSPSSDELGDLVICADSYDAPQPADGLAWWADLWANMTAQSWISGNSRFFNVFPCNHFTDYWPEPAEVYRGDLNKTLKHPVLLIAETYDPATPLRNGRRLLNEMGRNARLIAHHGYGHSSRDTSNCTDSIAKDFILHGTLPDEAETACYADKKPYLYDVDKDSVTSKGKVVRDPIAMWQQHVEEIAAFGPRM